MPLGQLLPTVLGKDTPGPFTESPFTSHVILTCRISKDQEVREDRPQLPSLVPPLTDQGHWREHNPFACCHVALSSATFSHNLILSMRTLAVTKRSIPNCWSSAFPSLLTTIYRTVSPLATVLSSVLYSLSTSTFPFHFFPPSYLNLMFISRQQCLNCFPS